MTSPPRNIVPVLLPMPLGGSFEYALAEGIDALPGSLVRVPLGRRDVVGVVWDHPIGETGSVNPDKVKDILVVLELPPLSADVRTLISFISEYMVEDPGRVLSLALSPRDVLAAPPARTLVAAGNSEAAFKATDARKHVLAALQDGQSVAELAAAAGVSDAVVRGLIKAGRLIGQRMSRDLPYPPLTLGAGPPLNEAQRAAADQLVKATIADSFSALLLDGVTGSGKTEVYLEAVDAALARGGQALVLLPEIGLTTQMVRRFEVRFGSPPILWHSGISKAEKRRAWQALARGEAQLVLGARSSLFLPFKTLRLIVVDEEHDPSYRQEDGVKYHARDMAVVRARAAKCPIILASATPSLESATNAQDGKYQPVVLDHRFAGAVLPDTEAVDMRPERLPADRFLSSALVEALRTTLDKGEQSLLFLNRRGYAPLTLCRACGHRLQCPECDAWLVEHRFEGRLQCHQCGHYEVKPTECPECGAEDMLAACGPGVERLSEEVAAHFPEARLSVLTTDTLSGPTALAAQVHAIEAGDVDIIIGTQLVTKGYHFPALTLVGVVDADMGLKGGDLRAGERTIQQLTQVAGRAGRADKKGRVLIQSYDPDNPAIKAMESGDLAAFLALEQDQRRAFQMPPFGRLAGVIISGANEAAVQDQARLLVQSAPQSEAIRILGPAPAPFARLRGKYRMRLLVHGAGRAGLQPAMRQWFAGTRFIKGVRVDLDIDPYSFL